LGRLPTERGKRKRTAGSPTERKRKQTAGQGTGKKGKKVPPCKGREKKREKTPYLYWGEKRKVFFGKKPHSQRGKEKS